MFTNGVFCISPAFGDAVDYVNGFVCWYGIIDLREIMLVCNQRYLAFPDGLDDTSAVSCDFLLR